MNNIVEYKEGMLLGFSIYGTTVKGTFVKLEDDLITIMVTHDFIKENIGTEQTIHIDHKHRIIEDGDI